MPRTLGTPRWRTQLSIRREHLDDPIESARTVIMQQGGRDRAHGILDRLHIAAGG